VKHEVRSSRTFPPHDSTDLKPGFAHVSDCKMDGKKHGNKAIYSLLVANMAATHLTVTIPI